MEIGHQFLKSVGRSGFAMAALVKENRLSLIVRLPKDHLQVSRATKDILFRLVYHGVIPSWWALVSL